MSNLSVALYDPVLAPLEAMGLRRWRQWAVRAAKGQALEIGVGTGLNLRHYSRNQVVVAIDPDGASLHAAKAKMAKATSRICLVQARAEELPFANDAFDAVLGTLVFCTVGNPDQGVIEARRVLQTGGRFRLAEHVRSGNRFIASIQNMLTPSWKLVADGCNLNRDTLASVERAGFQIRSTQKRLAGVVIGIDAVK